MLNPIFMPFNLGNNQHWYTARRPNENRLQADGHKEESMQGLAGGQADEGNEVEHKGEGKGKGKGKEKE
jgi:hypothetical protein